MLPDYDGEMVPVPSADSLSAAVESAVTGHMTPGHITPDAIQSHLAARYGPSPHQCEGHSQQGGQGPLPGLLSGQGHLRLGEGDPSLYGHEHGLGESEGACLID